MTAPHVRTARSGDRLRILRAAVFAAVCVVLAAAGHTLASCGTVPLWTLGAGFLGSLALVAPLAGRERSLPGIAALLALGQTVLHTLFGLSRQGMPAGSMDMSGTGSTGSTHSMAGMTGMTGMSGMQHAGDAAGSPASLLPSLPMLLAHVLSAAAVGWLMRRGDRAVLRLVELSAHGVAEGALVRALRGALALVRTLCAGLPDAPEGGPRQPRTDRAEPPAPRTTALQHTVIRRGPPVAALSLATF
ncbi:hypothetical protein [Streptomyces sp. NPDC086787]|uniref:hypothetical protein n=1 Tax=Streptomyces sp. NPDC086787 TaxID=3365759 RepID=UPI00382CA0C6